MSTIFNIDLDILKQLIRVKFTDVRTVLLDRLINFYIWAGCTMLVSGYLMKAFGLSNDFGPFLIGGMIAAVALFEVNVNVINFVADLDGDHTIAYYLTLSTHTVTVLCSHIFYYATIGTILGVAVLPLAKIILYDRLNLFAIAWPKLLFFIILINLFCATITLWLSALIGSMKKIGVLWTRIICPLWLLGGFQFSWISVHSVAPKLSYILLLNPVIYMSEGIRAALLNKNDTIPFWICCVVLFGIWVGIAFLAYKALKKQLDFV